MIYNIFEPWKSLDPWQKKYIETEGNCFLLCGRQSGKSAAASIKFGRRAAIHSKRAIYMLAYTEKQAYNLFFKTLMYLKSEYPKMLITLLPFFNFLDMILEIMIFFFKLSIWLVLSYFLIKGMFFYRYIFIKLKEKRIERRTKERKEFIKELAKEIKSKKK